MIMTLRWFGQDHDGISLKRIRQIPGVEGVIATLYGTNPGEVWAPGDIAALIRQVEEAGLKLVGIESVNVVDQIKYGGCDRDLYIANYIKTLTNLGQAGIKLVCYNFMPVFDWTRSELNKQLPDGSLVLSYDQEQVNKIDPEQIFNSISTSANGFTLPGWEPSRLATIKELFACYQGVDEEALRKNLGYFLSAIMPVCNQYGIKMALHPDDPSWNVFGLPRIAKNLEDLMTITQLVDDVHNGITFCSGSLGSNPNNDLVAIIHALKGRIHFAHVRNIKHLGPRQFDEAPHLSALGSLDLYQIIKALVDIDFHGPIRPDHGRTIWDEVAMPGYGLYDRALGACYLSGLIEAIRKGRQ